MTRVLALTTGPLSSALSGLSGTVTTTDIAVEARELVFSYRVAGEAASHRAALSTHSFLVGGSEVPGLFSTEAELAALTEITREDSISPYWLRRF